MFASRPHGPFSFAFPVHFPSCSWKKHQFEDGPVLFSHWLISSCSSGERVPSTSLYIRQHGEVSPLRAGSRDGGRGKRGCFLNLSLYIERTVLGVFYF